MGFWSCTKDKTKSPKGIYCEEFPEFGISFFSYERFQYMSPCFNPNNVNEFVYSYEDKVLGVNQLIVYNTFTEEKTIIVTNVKIISQPKWSVQGWIAFDNVYNGNYQIWKVKSDGDSLEQLSTNLYNLFPTWDASGNNLYYQHSSNLGVPYYTVRQGLYSSQIDTVYNGFTGYIDISQQNRMFAKYYVGSTTHFGATSLNSSLNFFSLINADENNFVGLTGTSWSSAGNEVYFSCVNGFESSGLYRMNASSGNYDQLVEYCDNRHYKIISCSPDDNSLIVEKVMSKLILNGNNEPTGEIRRQSKIYLVNLITFNETEVILD